VEDPNEDTDFSVFSVRSGSLRYFERSWLPPREGDSVHFDFRRALRVGLVGWYLQGESWVICNREGLMRQHFYLL